ncbi:MAG: sulfotransferase family 2 domain-containing protein [Pseudomonadales bacterium]
MIISDEPSFIFIAVPKTGSCAVEEALQPLMNAELKRQFHKHVTAMRLERELPAERWENSYKFSFVREPYAWMHSWYRFRQRDELKDPTNKYHRRYTGDISFNEFVQTFSSKELMLKQSDVISNRSAELLMDFVGRYETLQSDFDTICEQLNIPLRKLPRVNVTKSTASGEDFLDAAGIKIINDYFSQDFEMFGYTKRTGSLTFKRASSSRNDGDTVSTSPSTHVNPSSFPQA